MGDAPVVAPPETQVDDPLVATPETRVDDPPRVPETSPNTLRPAPAHDQESVKDRKERRLAQIFMALFVLVPIVLIVLAEIGIPAEWAFLSVIVLVFMIIGISNYIKQRQAIADETD